MDSDEEGTGSDHEAGGVHVAGGCVGWRLPEPGAGIDEVISSVSGLEMLPISESEPKKSLSSASARASVRRSCSGDLRCLRSSLSPSSLCPFSTTPFSSPSSVSPLSLTGLAGPIKRPTRSLQDDESAGCKQSEGGAFGLPRTMRRSRTRMGEWAQRVVSPAGAVRQHSARAQKERKPRTARSCCAE
ncbi:hypothetical protein BC629DRAFT_323750 [Irpex lacteus]|nr:hypothetical protein BC629DRAFT_323750 [Irpex lacteus]